MFGINAIQYHELDTFMKNRTSEIIFIPDENSIKIVMKFSDVYSAEEVLAYMCRKIDFFEESLLKALKRKKSASDIEFEEKMIKILGKNRSEKYGITSESSVFGKKNEELKLEKTKWKSEKIYEDYVNFDNENQNIHFLKSLKRVIIPTIIFGIIYSSFYIMHGYVLSNVITKAIILICISFGIAFCWSKLSLPSYVLTKKFGLREKIGEKFYGTLSNGMSFYVTPSEGRRIFKNMFFFDGPRRRLWKRSTSTYYELKFSIKLERGEEYSSKLVIPEDIADIALENEMNSILKTITNAYGIEDENIIVNCHYRYNIIAIIFNILTFRRCVDFLHVFFPIFFIEFIASYGFMIYCFIVDFIRYL